ncbi:ubiquitin-like protein Pup [Saccharopolyspora sp. NPDC050642]|uniref:ubiquitin-like protein Pup n=1 Tax=Saccharopolyspora sp. NPDC050642 TaxID=3157099 RepID=UPI0034031396
MVQQQSRHERQDDGEEQESLRSGTTGATEHDMDKIDELIKEIDAEISEEEAERFVSGFIQKGGQ